MNFGKIISVFISSPDFTMPIKGRLKSIQHRLNLSRKDKERRKKTSPTLPLNREAALKQENPTISSGKRSVGNPKSTEK